MSSDDFIRPSEEAITLVPCSGVQFLDYALNLDAVGRFTRTFIERRTPDPAAGPGGVHVTILPAWNVDDPEGPEPRRQPGDSEVSVNAQRALEIFLEKWVPVPILRVASPDRSGRDTFDEGPTNWARVRVVAEPREAGREGPTHRVILALDTQLIERKPNRPYVAPSFEDSDNRQTYRLVSRFDDVEWFLSKPVRDEARGDFRDHQEWVLKWVWDLFAEFKQARQRGRPVVQAELDNPLEHAARYFAFLELLTEGARPRPIEMLEQSGRAGAASTPIPVDLVLDIGNSRTCGILVEAYPDRDSVDLTNTVSLRLRDLGRPERVCADPFESHVELAQASFGRDDLSAASTRQRAFFWPSLVRTGPEAARIRTEAEGSEALSGLSSPKRYLWDTSATNHVWRFHPQIRRGGAQELPIERVARRYLSTRGDVISYLEDPPREKQGDETALGTGELAGILYGRQRIPDLLSPASAFTFSRSAFYGFMVSEIVWQAMTMVNAYGFRASRHQTDVPRRLRRIIFTLPTATPIREQQIIRLRAEAAVQLIWDMMGWLAVGPGSVERPRVHVSLDEASCVHFIYLYGEIAQKFTGQIDDYLKLAGRPRAFAEPEVEPAPGAPLVPSLRVASIDVGGGTTDLMITTYFGERNRTLKPVQTFREGFRIAGDDVLKTIVERHVLRAVESRLSALGLPDAAGFLKEHFADRANLPVQARYRRLQFVKLALIPVGLAILSAYERSQRADLGAVREVTVAELLAQCGLAPVGLGRFSDYLVEPLARRGIDGFVLDACPISLDFAAIGESVRGVLEEMLATLAEAVHALDPDVLLLTGRPSRLPALQDMIADRLALAPDRLVPMHLYRVGGWYPFRDIATGRIDDPKTTAAVGCMLCALSERQLVNFRMETSRLAMRSTARYVGELESNNQLRPERVLFGPEDLASRDPNALTKTIVYDSPLRIGFRQLPYARWTATPLYALSATVSHNSANRPLPFHVPIQREVGPPEAGKAALGGLDDARFQGSLEALVIDVGTDADGGPLKSSEMRLTLNTLSVSGSYWIDDGVLSPS